MSKYFKKTLVIFLSSILLLLIVTISILWGFSNDLPDYKFLKNYKAPVSSKVYSGDELPVIKIKKDQINNGLNIIDLSIKTNLFSSKSEIRRTIKNSGLKINNSTVTDENLAINVSDFEDDVLKLSHGKKNHVLIKIIG